MFMIIRLYDHLSDVSNYIINCPGPHLRRSIQHLCGSLTKQSRERFSCHDDEEEDDNSDANNDVDSHDNQDTIKRTSKDVYEDNGNENEDASEKNA